MGIAIIESKSIKDNCSLFGVLSINWFDQVNIKNKDFGDYIPHFPADFGDYIPRFIVLRIIIVH